MITGSCFQIMTTGPQRKIGRLAGATQLCGSFSSLELQYSRGILFEVLLPEIWCFLLIQEKNWLTNSND
jgi:hypothetical protein